MNILLATVRGLCRIGISIALSAWIVSATVQATVLNRDAVKGWLVQSGVYDKGLSVQIQPGNAGASLIGADMLQKAFAKTFDSTYLRANGNRVIDATYDWLEGKTKAITFSIPVQDKANDFAQNMADLLEVKLAALPVCSSRMGNPDVNNITCLPRGVSAADYARELTKPSGSDMFLSAPLTQDMFTNGGAFEQFSWLPASVQATHVLFIGLPFVLLVLGGLFVLVSPDKIVGASRLGRQIAISSTITLVGGILLLIAAPSIDLGNTIDATSPQQAAAIKETVNALAHTILPDFGRALSLYSGLLAVVGGMLWVGMFVWHHKRSQLPLPELKAPETDTQSTLPETPKKD